MTIHRIAQNRPRIFRYKVVKRCEQCPKARQISGDLSCVHRLREKQHACLTAVDVLRRLWIRESIGELHFQRKAGQRFETAHEAQPRPASTGAQIENTICSGLLQSVAESGNYRVVKAEKIPNELERIGSQVPQSFGKPRLFVNFEPLSSAHTRSLNCS